MKGMILSFVMLLATGVSAAGALPQNLDRNARRAIAAKEDSLRSAVALNALTNMDFVLEADRLVLKRGENVIVQSEINFVSVKGDKAVIQVAPFSGPGANGVGGVTVEGNISDVELKTDRRGNTTLSMYVSGSVAACHLIVNLPKGGLTATARIDPTFSSNDITLVGGIVPTEQSRIYQGNTL